MKQMQSARQTKQRPSAGHRPVFPVLVERLAVVMFDPCLGHVISLAFVYIFKKAFRKIISRLRLIHGLFFHVVRAWWHLLATPLVERDAGSCTADCLASRPARQTEYKLAARSPRIPFLR